MKKTVLNQKWDLKAWNDWKCKDKLCAMCGECEEDFEHFMSCALYGYKTQEIYWKYTYAEDSEK